MDFPLTNPWTLSFTHPLTGQAHRLPATVPGNVEIDLGRAGLIADPMPQDDLHATRDWERVDDWTYETAFDAPPHGAGDTVQLVFAGVDTIADVWLNGEPLLRCDNMFIPHAAAVTGRLRPSGNALKVRIYSPVRHARQFDYDAFQAPIGRHDAAYLRKARHMWGWDNAPRLLSAGLWRPVHLAVLPPVRFDEVYLYTQQITGDEVFLGCDWRIATPDLDLGAYRGVLRLSRQGRAEHERPFAVEFVAGRFHFRLPRSAVRLWWPRGFGAPDLYEATLELHRGEAVVATWTGRIGIRDLRLARSEDVGGTDGGDFVFVCNGERVYINGTNWKPLDALHGRAEEKVRRALDLCLDLNCNMVRVWGGGVYEDHGFFDYCDEQGLLVWQDFMLACELPPRDAWFQEAVAREAAAIVKRLRHHPSLAVWCGDNEVDASLFWGTRVPHNLLPADNVISRRVLAEAVQAHDPYRGYVPSSPYFSDRIARQRRAGQPATAYLPEDHLYPCDENFRDAYRNSRSLFIGETGPFFINAVAPSPEVVAAGLRRARRLWDTPIARADYTIHLHQIDVHFLTWKDAARARLRHQFGREFPLEPWADLALGINIVCGEMFKFAIEWSRSRKWGKTGVLWWSVLDMWPMLFNYSVVDCRFRPKQPCYDWIRQSQQPFCLLVADPGAGDLELFAANDTMAAHRGDYRVVAMSATGDERELDRGQFAVEPNQNVRLRTFPRPAAQALWLLEWQTAAGRQSNHFVAGEPPFDFDVYRRWVARAAAPGNPAG